MPLLMFVMVLIGLVSPSLADCPEPPCLPTPTQQLPAQVPEVVSPLTNFGSSAAGDNSCAKAFDGVCDEPPVCALASDSHDCRLGR